MDNALIQNSFAMDLTIAVIVQMNEIVPNPKRNATNSTQIITLSNFNVLPTKVFVSILLLFAMERLNVHVVKMKPDVPDVESMNLNVQTKNAFARNGVVTNKTIVVIVAMKLVATNQLTRLV